MEQLMMYETLSFSEAINRASKRIFQFTGRSRRSEYWWTMLATVVVSTLVPVTAIVLDILTIPLTFRRLHDTGRTGWWWGIRYIFYFIFICFIIDDFFSFLELLTTGAQIYSFLLEIISKYSLWMIFILIYHVVFLIILCLDGEQGWNEYGDSEKYFIEVSNE